MLSKAISASSNGDNTIVAAVSNRRIRVLGFVLTFSAAVNVKWKDGASTDLTGLLYGVGTAPIPVQAPCVPPVMGCQPGWFATSQGNALVLNLSGAVAVGGFVLYDLVP